MSVTIMQTVGERCSCMVCVIIACVTRAAVLSQQGDTIEEVDLNRIERVRRQDSEYQMYTTLYICVYTLSHFFNEMTDHHSDLRSLV